MNRLSQYLLDSEQGQEHWIVLRGPEKGFGAVQ